MIAITHIPSPGMQRFQNTFVSRQTIDIDLANTQHAAYRGLLQECGAQVRTFSTNCEFPDCVFVEDTAVVLDEVAILGAMGTESRRPEPEGIKDFLAKYREITTVELPATLEGGDVLQIGRTLLVGISSRTNEAGSAALHQIARRFGYEVVPVRVSGCLHLKTACTALPDGRLLINPTWIDLSDLEDFDKLFVCDEEPWSANVLPVGSTVCLSAAHPLCAAKLDALGYEVKAVDITEFEKAEGGVTCLSLILGSP